MMATLTKVYIRNLYHTFVYCKSLLWPNFTVFQGPLCGHEPLFMYIICIYQSFISLSCVFTLVALDVTNKQ